MPAPTTVAELIDLIQKSNVVEPTRLAAYLQQIRDQSGPTDEPSKVVGQMIRDGILTNFQAEQFLQGKWKRFTIGKYKVLERLGAGGMGHVFLCEHAIMRRRVAVKVLPSAKSEDDSSRERFYREARAVAKLDHPNLVRAHDIDQDESLHFLVMEYVDGPSLHEIVRRTGPMDPVRACHYIYQASLGLQYAFEVAELVHRDIKPGNILVDRVGQVKILDMGLARFFNDEEDVLTRRFEEKILGTADYLSPEQARDSHDVDIRADIYSLGATFYFILTGQPPFPEGSVAQKLIWHQTRSPKPVRLLRSDIPEGIAAVIERMMAKDPATRYQAPAEVAVALTPFVQTPIPPPCDAELPQLSPAASAGGTPTVNSVSGRYAIPRLAQAGRYLVGPAAATAPAAPPVPTESKRTPLPPTIAAQASANPSSATDPLRPPLVTPLRGSAVPELPLPGFRFNPFANLPTPDATPSASATARKLYAPVVAPAAVASLPSLGLEPTAKARRSRLGVFLTVVALAVAGGYALWHYDLVPLPQSVAGRIVGQSIIP